MKKIFSLGLLLAGLVCAQAQIPTPSANIMDGAAFDGSGVYVCTNVQPGGNYYIVFGDDTPTNAFQSDATEIDSIGAGLHTPFTAVSNTITFYGDASKTVDAQMYLDWTNGVMPKGGGNRYTNATLRTLGITNQPALYWEFKGDDVGWFVVNCYSNLTCWLERSPSLTSTNWEPIQPVTNGCHVPVWITNGVSRDYLASGFYRVRPILNHYFAAWLPAPTAETPVWSYDLPEWTWQRGIFETNGLPLTAREFYGPTVLTAKFSDSVTNIATNWPCAVTYVLYPGGSNWVFATNYLWMPAHKQIQSFEVQYVAEMDLATSFHGLSFRPLDFSAQLTLGMPHTPWWDRPPKDATANPIYLYSTSQLQALAWGPWHDISFIDFNYAGTNELHNCTFSESFMYYNVSSITNDWPGFDPAYVGIPLVFKDTNQCSTMFGTWANTYSDVWHGDPGTGYGDAGYFPPFNIYWMDHTNIPEKFGDAIAMFDNSYTNGSWSESHIIAATMQLKSDEGSMTLTVLDNGDNTMTYICPEQGMRVTQSVYDAGGNQLDFIFSFDLMTGVTNWLAAVPVELDWQDGYPSDPLSLTNVVYAGPFGVLTHSSTTFDEFHTKFQMASPWTADWSSNVPGTVGWFGFGYISFLSFLNPIQSCPPDPGLVPNGVDAATAKAYGALFPMYAAPSYYELMVANWDADHAFGPAYAPPWRFFPTDNKTGQVQNH